MARFRSPKRTVVTYLETWRLAWPLILSNLTVPLLGMVDTAVVGHLPAAHHLGAVALGAATFSALYFAFFSLRIGTTGLTAQAYGAGDHIEIRATLVRALTLAAVIGLLLIALMQPVALAARHVFAPTPLVAAGLDSYLSIRLLAAPAALCNMVLLGWLLGMQDARSPLVLLVTGNGINIVLDIWFVFGLDMEVAGVALATVIAEYGTLALGAALGLRHLRRFAAPWSLAAILDLGPIGRLIGVNVDMFIRSLCLQAGFVTMTALGSRQSDIVLAANTVLMNLMYLAAFSLDGFAHAASTLVGRHSGARDRRGLRLAVRAGLHFSLAFGALFSIAFVFGGHLLIDLLTDLADIRTAARTYLPYMMAVPLIAATAFLFDGVFSGATRTAEMRNGMIGSLLVFLAAAWLMMPVLGNHGLWAAFMIFMAARGLWLGAVYWHLERGTGFIQDDQVRRGPQPTS